MSSYMYFALKNKGVVAPLNCVCRSSELYQAVKDYAPYEKLAPISGEHLNYIREDLVKDINTWKGFIEDREQYLEYLKTVAMTPEERGEAWYDAQNYISETKEEIKWKEDALGFIDALLTIYYEVKDINEYYKDEYKIDPDNYIYVGIECGFFRGDEDE